MTKSTASQDSGDTMTHFDLFKKFKRFNPLEPSFGIVGFFLVTVLFVCSFFFLDCTAVVHGLRNRGFVLLGLRFSSLSSPSPSPSPSSLIRDARVDFLHQDGDGCDVFNGNWVWDENYPLYQSTNCSFLDQGFRCNENGRPDSFYTNWRWQPRDCNLPRFDAGVMLEKLRGKRLVFVGDSIGRNQWESLLCLLSSAITNKTSVYEVNGSPISKHTGFLAFKFKDFDCTVEYHRSPFLVVQGRAPRGAPKEARMTLKVDQMDWTSYQWKSADMLVLNTGHWWNYQKTLKMGCYFQVGEEVKMNMGVEDAFRKSMETVIDWIAREVNTNKTYVLIRTYAPVHFRGGAWNTGGGCHLETLPNLGTLPVLSDSHFRTIFDVLEERLNKSEVINLDLLNITPMSLSRKDGHPSVYYQGPNKGPAPMQRQDCSHWCLPGVPDSWNEILFALLLKRETFRARNMTRISQDPS